MAKVCSNLAFTCMDFRFRDTYNDYIRSIGSSDRIALAGASKAIVDEDTRSTALKQLILASQLHGVNTIYLIDHEDCGGYGGKAVAKSDEDEIRLHQETAVKAKEIIAQELKDVRVVTKMALLNGDIIDL